MSFDTKTANAVLAGLRPFPVAVTTLSGGRANGLISLSAGSGGIIDEAPRVTISLTKFNFTHDLVKDSGVFVMHLLSADADIIEQSLAIIKGLGGRSGRDGDKIGEFDTRPGVTGAPILLDALSYIEGRVVGELDNEENSIFLADVVAAEALRTGPRLNIGTAWAALPKDWTDTYERNHLAQTHAARRARDLPELAEGH